MSRTFVEILRIVREYGLNGDGFMQRDIIRHIPHFINLNTVRTFIWKHSEGGGNVNVVYFEKNAAGRYTIKPKFYNS